MWYRLRIYMCEGDHRIEANGCGKLTLTPIERSQNGLRRCGTRGIDALIATLNRLEGGIETRFPLAFAYVRVGLDGPAA